MIQNIGTFIASQLTELMKKISVVFVHIFILLLSLFYFLRDGDKIKKYIKELLPLPERYRKELFEKLFVISKAIIFGIFVAAIIQGVVAGIGFFIAGVSNVIFWGTLTAFFSIVPYLGTAIIWVPMVLFLFLSGNWPAAIFLTICGLLLVSTADNIVKPYLIGGKARLYPLVTFFVILGGIFTIGLKGLIFGPFVLVLVLTFLHIYRLEHKKALKEQ